MNGLNNLAETCKEHSIAHTDNLGRQSPSQPRSFISSVTGLLFPSVAVTLTFTLEVEENGKSAPVAKSVISSLERTSLRRTDCFKSRSLGHYRPRSVISNFSRNVDFRLPFFFSVVIARFDETFCLS